MRFSWRTDRAWVDVAVATMTCSRDLLRDKVVSAEAMLAEVFDAVRDSLSRFSRATDAFDTSCLSALRLAETPLFCSLAGSRGEAARSPLAAVAFWVTTPSDFVVGIEVALGRFTGATGVGGGD